MNLETTCPECSGVGTFRNSDGLLVPCFQCRGAGVLIDDSSYRHLEPVHTVWSGICTDCAGTGCDRCRNTGRTARQFAREIGHLEIKRIERKPVRREMQPGKERKEA